MESSSSFLGSSKRAKAVGNNTQTAHCLVDGCNADLSLCRDYHRRHKVCETHSKTPKVTIGGREQRFCQQCSRFHSLVEFDEGKRSCRKRLEGHNRRRRKPQPDSSLSRGLLYPSGTSSTTLLSFTNTNPTNQPRILPSSVVGSSSWASSSSGPVIKAENNEMAQLYNTNNNQQLNYIDRNADISGITSSQKLMSFEGLNHEVVDSDRALSLLSSASAPPPIVVTREFGLNHTEPPLVPQPDHQRSLLHHHHHHSLQYDHHGYTFDQERKPAAAAQHFPNMFQQAGNEGSSSTSGPHQTLTFMWE